MSRFRTVLVLLAATATTAAAATLVEHRVGQKNKAFSVPALTVKSGEKVVFHNDDTVPHNVYSPTAGATFNVRMQQPGEDAFVTFATPGKVEVRCAFHPGMKMAITVAP